MAETRAAAGAGASAGAAAAPPAGAAVRPPRKQPLLARLYLILYNVLQAVGWAAALVIMLRAVLDAAKAPGSAGAGARGLSAALAGVWAAGLPLVRVLQAASGLEILHAAVRLVPSSPAPALVQWAGRCHVLFCVERIPSLHTHPAAAALLLAWGAAEVCRYPAYAAAAAGSCPRALTWLRYTAFIPLYPLGAGAEMVLLYLALPTLQRTRMWSVALPNRLNFAFPYPTFVTALLMLYPVLWGQLYAYMFRQRSARLRAGGGERAKRD